MFIMNAVTNSKIVKKILSDVRNYGEEKFKKEEFVPYVSKIPVTGKVLDSDDLVALVESSLDAWLTSGEYTEKFEKKIAEVTGTRHCLFVNSGSSANLAAMSAIANLYELKSGDEVITSAVNFPTTLNPIIQNNLTPVLVDAEIGTYNVSVEKVANAINEKTKGIVLAHTLGNPFDSEALAKLCEDKNLFLLEDSCDSLGSTLNGKHVGTFGDAGTLSFYPDHHITTGEGGAIFFNNSKLKKVMESIRDWGRDCYCAPGKDNTCNKRYEWQLGGLPFGYDHKYIYSNIGYNLKATDMQAAIGLTQIEKLPEFIEKRINNFNYIYKKFEELDEFDMPESLQGSVPSWFGFPITLKKNSKFKRVDLLRHYEENRIGSRLLFGGNVTLQPAYSNVEFKISGSLENADRVVEDTFWLGVYPGITFEMIDFMHDVTKEFFSKG